MLFFDVNGCQEARFLAFEGGWISLLPVFAVCHLIPSWWPAGHQDGRVS